MKLKRIFKFIALCLLVLAVPCLWFTACASGGGGTRGLSVELPKIEGDIEVFPQLGHGHSDSIISLVQSPDGKYILSSGYNTIKLWDINTLKEIRTFDMGSDRATFSSDGKMFLSEKVTYDATLNNILYTTITMWDTLTGNEIWKTSGDVGCASLSPDGKKVLFYSFLPLPHDDSMKPRDSYGRFINNLEYNLKICDSVSGDELHSFPFITSRISNLRFSPDGKQVLINSSYEDISARRLNTRIFTIKLFDIITGSELVSIPAGQGMYSPDGKYILSCRSSSGLDYTLELWDVLTGNKIRNFETSFSWNIISFSTDNKVLSYYRDNIKIWDVNTGNVIKTFFVGSISNAIFSPDNTQIVTNHSSGFIKLWDVSTGRKIWEINNDGHRRVIFSNDGKNIITSDFFNGNYNIKILDRIKGQEVKTLSGNVDSCSGVQFVSEGKQIISQYKDIIKIWDIDTGTINRTFSIKYLDNYGAIMLSPDEKYALVKYVFYRPDNNNIFILWDMSTGKEIYTFSKSGDIHSVSYSADGKYLVAGLYDGFDLWDASSGRVIRKFSEPSRRDPLIVRPIISSNGKYIISVTELYIKLWNSSNGRVIRTFTRTGETGSYLQEADFTSDDKHIISKYTDEVIIIWNVETGEIVKTFSSQEFTGIFNEKIYTDYNKFIFYSRDNSTILFNFATEQEIQSFNGRNKGGYFASMSKDEKQIIFSSGGTFSLWDVATGKEIAQFVSFSGSDSQISLASRGLTVETQIAASSNDGEWLSITPDGYYQASPRGDRFLNVRVGNTVTGIDSYRSVFYNPDVVQARLQGRPDPDSKPNVTIQQAASFMPPQVTIKSPSTFTTTRSATTNLSVTVTHQNQPIKIIKIFNNGRAVVKNELVAIKGSNLQAERTSLTVTGNQRTVNFELPLTLDPGRNLIEVVAAIENPFVSNKYSESARLPPIEVTYNAPAGQQRQLPNLWVLAVGVNNYDNPAQVGGNLRFAVADAKRLTETLKSQEGRCYAKVNSLIIGDGEATLPTADNIKRSLSFLDQAGERDIVLLFLAGHGISAQNRRFFFLPKDAVVTGSSRNWRVDEKLAISGEEITAVLEGYGNRLLFIDACQSGGVDNNRMIRAMMESNAFVFAASQGEQFSYEDPRWGGGHGAFTFSILNALRGAPAALAENNVSVRSMSGFVSLEVPRMTQNMQKPLVHSLLFADFPLAVIK